MSISFEGMTRCIIESHVEKTLIGYDLQGYCCM